MSPLPRYDYKLENTGFNKIEKMVSKKMPEKPPIPEAELNHARQVYGLSSEQLEELTFDVPWFEKFCEMGCFIKELKKRYAEKFAEVKALYNDLVREQPEHLVKNAFECTGEVLITHQLYHEWMGRSYYGVSKGYDAYETDQPFMNSKVMEIEGAALLRLVSGAVRPDRDAEGQVESIRLLCAHVIHQIVNDKISQAPQLELKRSDCVLWGVLLEEYELGQIAKVSESIGVAEGTQVQAGSEGKEKKMRL